MYPSSEADDRKRTQARIQRKPENRERLASGAEPLVMRLESKPMNAGGKPPTTLRATLSLAACNG
jgi:hypothetical protein